MNTNLPLIDGALMIDNSTIELMRCPRLLQYSWLWRRALVAAKAGRNFGSGMHVGWAKRYELCGSGAVYPEAGAQIDAAMAQYFSENPPPPNDFRTYHHACTVMAKYNEIYQDETFKILYNYGKPIIESTFALPFCKLKDLFVLPWDGDLNDLVAGEIPVYYCGKVDLGILSTVSVAGTGDWVHDHKTAFQFGQTFEQQMGQDGGQRGYCWALQTIRKQPVEGYIIDAVRIRKPRVSASYEGGGPVDNTDFIRMPFPITPEDLVEWRRDVESILQHIMLCIKSDHFPRHRWQCTNKFGACDMLPICSVPQHLRDAVVQGDEYEHNSWTPLNSPVTLTTKAPTT